jgi:hypothetical protein
MRGGSYAGYDQAVTAGAITHYPNYMSAPQSSISEHPSVRKGGEV